jgi:hypothetical protein
MPGESQWVGDSWPDDGGTNRPEVADPEDYFDAGWVDPEVEMADALNTEFVESSKIATTRNTLADPNVWKKLEALPALYVTDGQKGDRPAVRLFNPYGNGSWIIWEYDPVAKEGFGWADLGYGEMGYISRPFMGQTGLGIERDTSVNTMMEGFQASGTALPSGLASFERAADDDLFL